MISIAIFFLIIVSGGIFCTAFFHRKFEELLPVSCMVFVAVLFIFAIFDLLLAGVYAVLGLSALLYALTLVRLIKSKGFRQFFTELLSPAFFFFMFCFVALFLVNYGMQATASDEFSHWADTVKLMFFEDKLGSVASSTAFFPSYVPSMSLFQYLLERLGSIVSPSFEFAEWRLFFAYQMFMLSFFFPFLKNMRFDRPIVNLLVELSVFAAPLLLFNTVYIRIYIDPFLGVVSGAGLAMLFTGEKNDKGDFSLYTYIFTFLTAATLVLIKDSGIIFAASLALIIIFTQLRLCRSVGGEKGRPFNWKISLTGLLSVAVTRLAWEAHMAVFQTPRQFTGKIEFSTLLDVVTGRDSGSTTEVFHRYLAAFMDRKIIISTKLFTVPVIVFILLVFVGLILLSFLYKNKSVPDKAGSRRLVLLFAFVQTLLFAAALCITYMFKFTPGEAEGLNSFERYINTAILALWVLMILALIDIALKTTFDNSKIAAAALCGLLLLPDWCYALDFLDKAYVIDASGQREGISEQSDWIQSAVGDPQARIYVVSQHPGAIDYPMLRFSLRPFSASADCGYSLGEPLYDGDIITNGVSPEEWMDVLEESYDYVYLLDVKYSAYEEDSSFIRIYKELFERESDIAAGGLYRVDKDTRLLIRCA